MRIELAALRLPRFVWLGLAWIAAVGCGEPDPYHLGPTVPVRGTVLVNGKPLRLHDRAFGKVWFCPDARKGNRCPQVPFGTIDADGSYELTTRGTEGAPPGWYRVMVVATDQIDPHKPTRRRESLISRGYGAVETSGLIVEVLQESDPRAYDLKLKR